MAGIITMVLHPVAGHGLLPPPDMQRLATLDRVVHGLALGGVVMSFLGLLALTRCLSTGASRLPLAALVVYGFAAVAIMSAGAMSGFVGADLLSRLAEGGPQLETWKLLLGYTYRINQAFSAIYVVGTCAAIMLWSAAILRTRQMARGLGIYGVVLGPLILAALFSGNLPLDVHRFGMVVFTQAAWFILVGIPLARSADDISILPQLS